MSAQKTNTKVVAVGAIEPIASCFNWVLKNFSSRCKNSKEMQQIKSPNFLNGWWLIIYPKGMTDDSKDYISMAVACANDIPVTVTINLYILNSKRERCYTYASEKTKFNEPKAIAIPYFVNRSYIFEPENQVLSNGNLILQCELFIHSNDEPHNPFNVPFAVSGAYRIKEFDSFEKLLTDSTLSDLTFLISGRELPAHKNILMARSFVFQEMFKSVDSDQNSKLEVVDIPFEIFQELLRFIYCGKVERIDKIAKDLLTAADKYAIAGLKDLCEETLCNQLTNENVMDILKLADSHDAAKLKEKVIKYIKLHAESIVDKPEFELFGKLNYKLINEIVREIVHVVKKPKLEIETDEK